MHCPNCANESDLDQKFCRKCGFNLEPITKLILAGSADDDEAKLEQRERDKLLMRRMVSWMMWGVMILLIGVVLSVVNKEFHFAHLGLISTLLILGGVSVTTYGVLDALRCGGLTKPKAITESTATEIEKVSTTRELEGRLPIPLGSVTERTTQLIGADPDQRS